MADSDVEVIPQRDLIAALTGQAGFLDDRGIEEWPDPLTPRLDPDGLMLVTLMFPHNDGPDFRVLAMAKVIGSAEPVYVKFTLPGRYQRIVQRIAA